MRTTLERIVSFVRSSRFLSVGVHSVGRRRAKKTLKGFREWLPMAGRILDIGAGMGHLTEAVRDSGYDVIACDIVDLRFVRLPLIIADGSQLPFTDNTFDAALLIGVLHHMPTQLHVLVLQEGLRVLRAGGRLLVLEDTYHGNTERFATYVMDSVMNFEFIGHPHSNRSSGEWGNIIREIRGHLVHSRKYISWYGPFRFRHALLVIEKIAG